MCAYTGERHKKANIDLIDRGRFRKLFNWTVDNYFIRQSYVVFFVFVSIVRWFLGERLRIAHLSFLRDYTVVVY